MDGAHAAIERLDERLGLSAVEAAAGVHAIVNAKMANEMADRHRAHERRDREQLYLGVRTVESHRSRIQQKTGRSSRAELVRYALQHGLVEV